MSVPSATTPSSLPNGVPNDAIQCVGPLMYDLDRYVTPDGRLFKIHATTRRCREMTPKANRGGAVTPTAQTTLSWIGAERLEADGTTLPMEAIDNFYTQGGRVSVWGLLAYYFVEKIDPAGRSMRAVLINPSGAVHANNLQWAARVERLEEVQPNDEPVVVNHAMEGLQISTPPVATSGSPTAPEDVATNRVTSAIQAMIADNTIKEAMIPLVNGVPTPNAAMVGILEDLDPRGRGDTGRLQSLRTRIAGDYSCCYPLSYFGSTNDFQLVMCLKTLLVFKRSRDNLLNQERIGCPLCVFRTGANGKCNFTTAGPEMNIPVYRYSPGGKVSAINPTPYRFQQAYATMHELLVGESNVNTVLKPLRNSLCGVAMAKPYPNGDPKRAKCKNDIFSFFPPINDRFDESNPHWLLQRRLSAVVYQELARRVGATPDWLIAE